ncbi:MAG: hypothetical protein IT290_02690 [Deltaproteobacteria bacterium]|nr:hypothetical protein [Deltaproteobacteria bacterium]
MTVADLLIAEGRRTVEDPPTVEGHLTDGRGREAIDRESREGEIDQRDRPETLGLAEMNDVGLPKGEMLVRDASDETDPVPARRAMLVDRIAEQGDEMVRPAEMEPVAIGRVRRRVRHSPKIRFAELFRCLSDFRGQASPPAK